MKAMVTGGAGFIGSHIVDRLIELKHQVVVVDDFSSGKMKNTNPGAKICRVDITHKKELEAVFEKEKPEIVFHLAAQPFPSISRKEPERDAEINIIGSIIILELCKKYGVKKIIYSNSGGASYGNPEYSPIDELHPINPPFPYGISKHTAEHYIPLYLKDCGLKYTVFRYANIYGPRQESDGEAGVVSIFIKALLSNKCPSIFGKGDQVRDYCFVEDVVNANIWAINKGDNDVYNVGTGIGTSTQKIFDEIKKITDSPLEPVYKEERPGDMQTCILDSSKLQKEGWNPKINLKEGILRTFSYFKNER